MPDNAIKTSKHCGYLWLFHLQFYKGS